MSNMYPGYSTKLFTEIYENLNDFIYDYNNIGLPKTISVENCSVLYYLLYGKYGNTPIANFDENQFKYKLFSVIWQYGPTWEKRLDVQSTLRNLSLADLIDDGSINDLFTHSGTNSQSTSNSGTDSKTINESGTNTGTVTNVKSGSVTDAHKGTIGDSGSDTYNNYKQEKKGDDIHNHAYNPDSAPSTDELSYINEQTVDKWDNSLTTTGSVAHANTKTLNNTDTSTFNNVQDQRTDNLANSSQTTLSGTSGLSSEVEGEDSSNDSNVKTLTAGKLKAYEKLLELLDTDVTAEFLAKFNICFKQFVLPGFGYVYVTED